MYVAHGGRLCRRQTDLRGGEEKKGVQWVLVGSREMNGSGSVNSLDAYLYTLPCAGTSTGGEELLNARFHDTSRDSETAAAAKTGTQRSLEPPEGFSHQLGGFLWHR